MSRPVQDVRPAGVRGVRAVVVVAALSATASLNYTVESGDTLSEVAARHGLPTGELAAANDIADPDVIRAGTSLQLPVGGETEAAAAGTQAGVPAAGTDGEVERLLTEIAGKYNWRAATIKAIAWQESGWNQDVVSPADAIGVMQVLPGTGEFVSRELVGRSLDLDDPADNIEAGVAFLDYLYELTDGDARMTLAGYFQGLRSVDDNGKYDATTRYIDNVLALRERF